MEYTNLGNTGIRVSKLCVGCMSFGKPGTLHDWTLDEAGTEAIVKHALDLGINFLTPPTAIPTAPARNISAGRSRKHRPGQGGHRLQSLLQPRTA